MIRIIPGPDLDMRHDGWPEVLAACIRQWQQQPPLGWGATDCASFVCACLIAMGRDDLVPRWSLIARDCPASAARAIRRINGIDGWFRDRCVAVPLAQAARGDVVVWTPEGGRLQACGIVEAGQVWSRSPDQPGLWREPLERLADHDLSIFSTGLPLRRLRQAESG